MKNSGPGPRRIVWPLLVFLLISLNTAFGRWKEDGDPTDSGGGQTQIPPRYVFPANGFSWEAPDRYSMWIEAWHERGSTASWPVETYRPEYVNPSSWALYVMGCQSEDDFFYNIDPDNYPKPTTKYSWSWDGNKTSPSTDCLRTVNFPAQGTYQVSLTATYANGTTETWTNPVRVEDFLIVVLGDSSASGEGAPDKPLGQFDGDAANADWVDNRCHRSRWAGGAQAAKRLEDAYPKSSVTFISFACSGATLITDSWYNESPLAAVDPYEIEDTLYRGVGLTDPYAGIEPILLSNGDPDFSQKLPAQTQALRRALRPAPGQPMRKVDALIVAGGINDVRFSDLAAVCVLYDGCPSETVGDEFNELPLTDQFQEDLKNVQPGWSVLRQQLFPDYDPIQADTRLALQYPGFFHDDNGDLCGWILDDAIPDWLRQVAFFVLGIVDLGWTKDEIEYANDYWAVWLDDETRLGATNNGFTYVDTINDRFYHHGMCAFDRYINTPTDAANIQGDDVGEATVLASVFSKGTAHPNGKGYAAYADEILNHLAYLTDNSAPVPNNDKIWGTEGLEKFLYSEVLFNDYDPDNDDLTAFISTLPAKGKLTMTEYGYAYWDPDGVTAPYSDSFFYTVSDGLATRLAKVDIYLAEMVLVPVTAVNTGSAPEPISVGGLIGRNRLEGPYKVVFPDLAGDGQIIGEFGEFRTLPGEDRIWYTPPEVKSTTRFEIRFQVQSETLDRNSLSYGEAIQGVLKIRVEPQKKG